MQREPGIAPSHGHRAGHRVPSGNAIDSASMTDRQARVLYRVVQADPPSIRDFMSYAELGVPPRRPLSPRDRDRWQGVSHYLTLAAAEAAARTMPHLGRFVASVRVPTDVRFERWGRDPNHCTVWAEAATLLGWVVSVTPVERVH